MKYVFILAWLVLGVLVLVTNTTISSGWLAFLYGYIAYLTWANHRLSEDNDAQR